MTKEENITVPRWFLEVVENTLRIQDNINLDKKTGETCQDRNIHQSLNGIRKLLNEEELTGMERLEKLQPYLPSNLDEAEFNYVKSLGNAPADQGEDLMIYDAFKAGAEWMAEQGETQEHFVIASIADSPCGPAVVCYTEDFEVGDEVIVQIRKKQ